MARVAHWQVRLVALPVAGLALVAAMAGMGMLPEDPLISFVILLQACPHTPALTIIMSLIVIACHFLPLQV